MSLQHGERCALLQIPQPRRSVTSGGRDEAAVDAVRQWQYQPLVLNGIPERFPKLNVIWMESGLAWLPFVVRLYFHAGSRDVRLVHTFVYDGDAGTHHAGRLPLPLRRNLHANPPSDPQRERSGSPPPPPLPTLDASGRQPPQGRKRLHRLGRRL